MRWHSVHVHYHDDQDDLLLDAVRPLFAQLDRPAYFLRHWKRGPHLRLNVSAPAEEVVAPVMQEALTAYLRAHPSRGQLDPLALLPLHERLAQMEAEPPPLVPWLPDNTVVDAEYEDRAATGGGAHAAELLADVHVAAQDVVFDALEHVRGGGSRLGVAFDLLVATAHASFPGGVERGFLSFRSHAEAFLTGTPEGPRLRPLWDRQFAAARDRLAGRIRAITAHGQELPLLSGWLTELKPLREKSERLIAAGEIILDPTVSAEPPPVLDSDFHRALELNPRWHEVRTSAWFGAYRLALNWTYLQVTRLGVPPVDRFLLCHLVANAVEDVYATSAMEVIRA